MKQYFSMANIVFALALTVFIIGFSAFSQKQESGKYSFRKEGYSKDNDTSSPGKHDRTGNGLEFDRLDGQLKQLEIQMKNLDNQLQNQNLQKYQQQAAEAIQKADFEKINKEIEKAIKNIRLEKINNRAETVAGISKLKMAEVQKELEQVKASFEKDKEVIKFNTKDFKLNIENALKKARISIESAKQKIENLKNFTEALQKDGLIDKSKAYKIEVKKGELYINDKKQTKEISNKYKQYYKDNNLSIDMNGENEYSI